MSPKRTILQGVVALLLTSMSLMAAGADLREVVVEKQDDRYKLRSETWFDADRDALYRILTDYEQFRKFTTAFVESRNVEPDEFGRPGFYTRMQGCVLMFCKSYIRAGHLILTPISDIIAVVDPELSNFKYARERWQLFPDGDGTLLIYTFEMEPDFWIPPLIGPYVVKRTLRNGGVNAVDRIEALAQGREPEF